MGTDTHESEFMFCVNGEPIGPLPELISIEKPIDGHLRDGEFYVDVDFPDGEITIKAMFSFWRQSCRSKRRFIRLMGGVFGVPRNMARSIAEEAMRTETRSYQKLWRTACEFFQQEVLSGKYSIERPVRVATDASNGVSD